jgi:hypothetical protein
MSNHIKKINLVFAIFSLAVFAPTSVFAAVVTVSDNTTLVLPSDNSEYTLLSGSTFEELFIDTNGSSFTFNMTGGQSVTLTSADKKTLTSNPAFTVTCGTTQSSVTLTLPTGDPAQPIIVTPGSTCSGSGGGGSPSIGQVTPTPTPASSGGGGSPPPPLAPAPAPKTTPSAVPAPASSGSIPPAAALVQSVFFKNLSPGNRGDAVRELQTLLRQDKTMYPEGIVNGVFGPATTRAVKKFQKKYGISQTGTTGPLTRTKLMQVFGGQKSGGAVPAPKPATPSANTQALQDQLTQLFKQLQELQKNKK